MGLFRSGQGGSDTGDKSGPDDGAEPGDPIRADWLTHVVVTAVVAGVAVPLFIWKLGPSFRDNAADGDRAYAVIATILVLGVVFSACLALFSPIASKFRHKHLGDRWRVSWATGLASLVILLITHVAFVWQDEERTRRIDSSCSRAVGQVDPLGPLASTASSEPTDSTDPSDSSASTEVSESTDVPQSADETAGTIEPEATAATEGTDESDVTDVTEETDESDVTDTTDTTDTTDATEVSTSDESTTTTEVLSPAPVVINPASARPIERFGSHRQLQWSVFVVTASPEDATRLAKLGCDAFVVLTNDDRPMTAFVSSVVALDSGQVAVRLNVDTSGIDAFDGGSYSVTAINTSGISVEPNRLELEVDLQSRVLYYFLAALPLIVMVALAQAFVAWPQGLKRWFASLVAVVSPAVAAFAATGLRNDRWSFTLFSVGTLLASTYTAAVTAATLAYKAGAGKGPQNTEPVDTNNPS